MNNQAKSSPEIELPGRNNNPENMVSAGQINAMSKLEIDSENWWSYAHCKNTDPNIFFPHDGPGVEIAKRICEECVAIQPCLEYAISNRIKHGVWGGTSERERTRIIRNRISNKN